MKFRLISQTTEFNCVKDYRNKLGVRCVRGVTTDGKRQTVARFIDVVWILS